MTLFGTSTNLFSRKSVNKCQQIYRTMIRRYFIFSLLIFAQILLNAQENTKCATEFLHKKYLGKNPELKSKFKSLENSLQKFITNQHFIFRSSEEIIKVPLVIHILHLGEFEGVGNNISYNQITSGIQQLNNAFRNVNGVGDDMKIEFELARQDPYGNKTTGIIRYDASGESKYASDGISIGMGNGLDEITLKALSKWPNDHYYNIWIVSEINGNNGGYGTQGFAYLPGASDDYDGSVIQNTAWGNQGTVNSWNNLGTTIIHELGHGLNLLHTFHTVNDYDTLVNGCPINTNCSLQGDFCCDTDPHNVSPSGSCDTNELNPCTGSLFGDIVKNYMDYSDQNCQTMFTSDQKDRMRGTLYTSRKSLLVSKALKEPVAPCESPIVAYCNPQTQSDGLEGSYTGIKTFEIENEIINTSNTAAYDNGYLDKTSDCSVTAFLNPNSSYKIKILPAGGNNITNSKVWIDYNNNGDFNSDELVFKGNHTGIIEDSSTFTVPENVVQNKFLRLRAVLDIEYVTNPCYEPRYGQVEDYSIYFYIPDENSSKYHKTLNKSSFRLFPNPAKSAINVEFEHILSNNIQLIIRDLQGRLIFNQSLRDSDITAIQIDISKFQHGIYNLSIQDNKLIYTEKFVVK